MILGIDEVGRGPLAGPLVMGACILNDNPREEWQEFLTDSKKISAKKREKLEPTILSGAAAWGIGWVSAEELDIVGMSEGLRLACWRAANEAMKIGAPFSEIIIDGPINFLAQTPLGRQVVNLNKADLLIKEVSAASIIAKVARDRYMKEVVAVKYPEYGFERHVGYGTKVHMAALQEYGACPEHRRICKPVQKVVGVRSFEKKQPTTFNATDAGRRAEEVVAEHLASKGHEIVARNFRTKYYEIDIVSVFGDTIYFTEVKYRKDGEHGSPLEMITREKIKQMRFAAEAFLHQQKKRFSDLKPKLAAAGVIGDNYRLETWFPLEVE